MCCGQGSSVEHRVADGHAPENTLNAVERGIELGADFVEFDVQRTRRSLVLMNGNLQAARIPEPESCLKWPQRRYSNSMPAIGINEIEIIVTPRALSILFDAHGVVLT